MRDRIRFIRSNRGAIMIDRILEMAIFEEEVAEIGERGGETFVEGEGAIESGERGISIAEANVRDAAFIRDERSCAVVDGAVVGIA